VPGLALNAPDVLKLAGHDVRWRLIRSLASSDRRVNELVSAVDMPQNLVSYHLRLLRDARLVSERRSSADGRDVYYHLELDRFAQAMSDSALAVRPSLASASAAPGARRRARVLFICTGNSARSQIAEAMLRAELGSRVDVRSAGPAPTTVHPLTFGVLHKRGIPVADLRSKGLDEIGGTKFDLVITLCDKAREACVPEEFGTRIVHWSLADPAEVKGSVAMRRRAFAAAADEIAVRIRHLLPTITTATEA
jgi:protein-tyrosine-phosphatase